MLEERYTITGHISRSKRSGTMQAYIALQSMCMSRQSTTTRFAIPERGHEILRHVKPVPAIIGDTHLGLELDHYGVSCGDATDVGTVSKGQQRSTAELHARMITAAYETRQHLQTTCNRNASLSDRPVPASSAPPGTTRSRRDTRRAVPRGAHSAESAHAP